MVDKCSICGEEFEMGIEGVMKCKNGHEKKKKGAHIYTYPLGDDIGTFEKGV